MSDNDARGSVELHRGRYYLRHVTRKEQQSARTVHGQHVDHHNGSRRGDAIFDDGLGLPLSVDGDYRFSEEIEGVKHFGVWPLSAAARACFGTDAWPTDRLVPQAGIEFDVDDVAAAARELEAKGLEILHPSRTEPWGQIIARLQGPSGCIVGVSHTPWMRTDEDTGQHSQS
jgi:catechol 2,3-dioxygenase-like lactoylglutathione lyase family enzyme